MLGDVVDVGSAVAGFAVVEGAAGVVVVATGIDVVDTVVVDSTGPPVVDVAWTVVEDSTGPSVVDVAWTVVEDSTGPSVVVVTTEVDEDGTVVVEDVVVVD